MASGKVHATVAITNGIICTVVASFWQPDFVLPVAIGAAISLFVEPDLDIENPTYSEYLPTLICRKIFGKQIGSVIGKIISATWSTFWLLYALIIPHRSILSHLPIVGTLLRLAYLSLPFLLLDFSISTNFFLYFQQNVGLISVAFAIVAINDILHFLCDGGMLFAKKGKQTYTLGRGFYNFMKGVAG